MVYLRGESPTHHTKQMSSLNQQVLRKALISLGGLAAFLAIGASIGAKNAQTPGISPSSVNEGITASNNSEYSLCKNNESYMITAVEDALSAQLRRVNVLKVGETKAVAPNPNTVTVGGKIVASCKTDVYVNIGGKYPVEWNIELDGNQYYVATAPLLNSTQKKALKELSDTVDQVTKEIDQITHELEEELETYASDGYKNYANMTEKPSTGAPEHNEKARITEPTQQTIPEGKALFVSGRTGNKKLIGVSLSKRNNSNDHVVYEAEWSDGYKSKYVFWSNGHAEIFSINGQGDNERTAARYARLSNGNLRITSETDSITEFPQFNPVTN